MNKITGIILAGGKSSRMGRDKAFIPFQGKKMIQYSIDAMKEVCPDILICANDPSYELFGYPVVGDNFKNIGPLGGLEAALSVSKTEINLFAPCDSPYLKPGLFIEILKRCEDYDAVVPKLDGGFIQPLAGYYSRKILPEIRQRIRVGDCKMQNLLRTVKTGYIPVKDYDMFRNMNRPGDLKFISQLST